MPNALQTINNILHTMRITLSWRSLDRIIDPVKGHIASTYIPNSLYSETDIHHSAVFTRHLLKAPRLEGQFTLLCSRLPGGHLFHITAEAATRPALFHKDPSGLEACLRYRHKCLAEALLSPMVTQDNLLIFPGLSELNFAENTELMATLQTLVVEPNAHEFSQNSNLDTVVHRLKTFHPDQASCVAGITATIPMTSAATAKRYGLSLLGNKKPEPDLELTLKEHDNKKSFG